MSSNLITRTFSVLIGLSVALICLRQGIAAPELAARLDTTDVLSSHLTNDLSRKHPGARIELTGSVRWVKGGLPQKITSVSVLSQTAKGEAFFVARGETLNEYAEGWVPFAAWVQAQVALRRVLPGERLGSDMFVAQDVNTSSGPAYEYRGVLLPQEQKVSGLEARQTILEGQYLLSSAVQRVPDVRRGDAVKIHLTAGELKLSTMGIAEEPAYLNGRVRVLSGKNKRELVGELHDDGVVEVRL
jgi:flagella basal body P-ring formation protein FlgA